MDNGPDRTLADPGPELALVDPCLPNRRGVASGRGRAAKAGGATLVPCGRRRSRLNLRTRRHWRRMLALAVLIFVAGAGGCT